jgi:hypothetical protein
MQGMIDAAFANDFENEKLYHARSGLTIRQIDDILIKHIKLHPSIKHVFFDHDLTLTCHQGLISIEKMNAVNIAFPLEQRTNFIQWASYFFGTPTRYYAIASLLENLKEKGIKTYILTKQPDTVTIEHFIRMCKLDAFFPPERCISSTKIGKEKLNIISETLGLQLPFNRSPRKQKGCSRAATQSPSATKTQPTSQKAPATQTPPTSQKAPATPQLTITYKHPDLKPPKEKKRRNSPARR